MTTGIIRSLDQVSRGYDGLLCDVWGVYHNGIRVSPEAMVALRRFRSAGGIVVLITNAPRPREAVAGLIAHLGGSAEDYDAIVTSGDAARDSLDSGEWGTRCFHIGPERDLGMVTGTAIERVSAENLAEAEFLLCTGLFDDARETAEDYSDLFRRARELDLPMLCSNPDVYVDRGSDRIPCAGLLAHAYAEAGGAVTWFGKPHPPIYRNAIAALETAAGREIPVSRILAIGDGILTDVAGAEEMGLDCLFITGGLAADEIVHVDGVPEPASLDRFLRRHGAAPAWAAERLA